VKIRRFAVTCCWYPATAAGGWRFVWLGFFLSFGGAGAFGSPRIYAEI